MEEINRQGDHLIAHSKGFGSDISQQRMDELDEMALNEAANEDTKDGWIIELGSGSGAMVRRFAEAGCRVVSVDLVDHEVSVPDRCRHLRTDLADLNLSDLDECMPFRMVFSQRTLHYLSFPHAVRLLALLRMHCVKGARIYLSLSGIGSELGNDYQGTSIPVELRMGWLSEPMQRKHGILLPVCLYSMSEAIHLLDESGWMTQNVWVSEFGNIKMIGG